MIKLTYYDCKEEDSVFYISKDNIGDMNRCENVTWIYTKGREPTTYRAKETPEEILAMPDIETKVIDWEQRRYELTRDFMSATISSKGKIDFVDYTDIFSLVEIVVKNLVQNENNEN